MAYSPSEMIWGSEGHHLSLAGRKQSVLLTGAWGQLQKSTQLGSSKNLFLLSYVSVCRSPRRLESFRTLPLVVHVVVNNLTLVLEAKLRSF